MEPSKVVAHNLPQAAKEPGKNSTLPRQEEARKEPSTSANVHKKLASQPKQNQQTRRKARASQPLPVDFDWCKYTHFRARNSAKDLDRLHRLTSSRSRQNLFDAERPDSTGLWPIHWAAINNRSDMIELMLKRGAKVDKPCRNRLLANGTPLHLAAMNGALEAADVLITMGRGNGNGNGNEQQTAERSNRAPREQTAGRRAEVSLLALRDADGQTPLMRAAAPRSKRMDTVRDLLRKNFWSLSGRPSEMALLLICHGARWRETEPNSGMNLMHLAIVNDYDDIVSLLLVLDAQLLDVPAANLQSGPNEQALPRGPSLNREAPDGAFETIDLSDRAETFARRAAPLDGGSSSTTSGWSSPTPDEPLIDERARAQQILANGLRPLQLAILYGRVAIISQLWHAKQREKYLNSSEASTSLGGGSSSSSRPAAAILSGPLSAQRRATQEHSLDRKRLKSVLFQATWSNREEFAKFLKAFLLKAILTLDLVLLAGLWAPLYAGSLESRQSLSGLKGGVFFISYCVSMALAFRVILRNPGYLRRNSLQYLEQMSRLMQDSVPGEKSSKSTTQTKPLIKLDSSSPESSRGSSQSSAPTPEAQAQPSIKTITPSVVEANDNDLSANSGAAKAGQPAAANQLAANRGVNANQRLETVRAELAKQAPDWQSKFDLKDTVRLLCHKCQCIRRPRSRHCNYCNHCVQDFDHHCIYLGCCIGRQNRLDFLLTLIMVSITGAYGTFLISYALSRAEWSSFWQIVAFIWVLKWVLIGLLLVFQNLRRACLGVSLYEEIRSKRLRHLFGRSGPSEEISNSHRAFSTLKDSFWRYERDRFLTGDQSSGDIWRNFNEFANHISCDEYLLSFICTDTPVARAIASSDSRTTSAYKLL